MSIINVWKDRHYLIVKRKEIILRWIVWHLPRDIVMWSYMRVAANATTGRYGATNSSELSMMDAIKRWDNEEK